MPHIHDRLYGDHEIDSPILIELLESAPVQRLKKIGQFGIPDELYHQKNFNRYEHCVGVMLLLKKLGASEEEQVAGLLHDVSHTAFSHVIDFVVGTTGKENYQDMQLEKYIYTTGLSDILTRHGYDPVRISASENFSLLEEPTPSLCADRLDYGLREFSASEAQQSLKGIATGNGLIVFTNISAARIFAEAFLKRQEHHWGSQETFSRYHIFTEALKCALERKIISFEDFWKTDEEVMEKIAAAKNEKILSLFEILKKPALADIPQNETIVRKKFRYVDPLVLHETLTTPLSQLDENFKKILEEARETNKKGLHVPETA